MKNNLKSKFFFLAVLFLGIFGWAESSQAVYPVAGRKKFPLLGFFFAFFILFTGFAFASPAYGADHYVRQGSIGSGNGTDWANAYGSLPASLVRGSTYYIADGSYPGYTFDDANSGTSVITIKKAVPTGTVNADYPSGMTAAQAHGTDTGWSDAYGDGQATFNGDMIFITDYFILDGQKRNESDWSSKSAYGISIVGVFVSSAAFGETADNVTLRYLDIGPDDGTTNLAGYGGAVIYLAGFTDTVENWIVERIALMFQAGEAIIYLPLAGALCNQENLLRQI